MGHYGKAVRQAGGAIALQDLLNDFCRGWRRDLPRAVRQEGEVKIRIRGSLTARLAVWSLKSLKPVFASLRPKTKAV